MPPRSTLRFLSRPLAKTRALFQTYGPYAAPSPSYRPPQVAAQSPAQQQVHSQVQLTHVLESMSLGSAGVLSRHDKHKHKHGSLSDHDSDSGAD